MVYNKITVNYAEILCDVARTLERERAFKFKSRVYLAHVPRKKIQYGRLTGTIAILLDLPYTLRVRASAENVRKGRAMQNARARAVFASRITWKATLNRPIYKYARENMEKRRERKKGRETKDKERDWGKRSRKGEVKSTRTLSYRYLFPFSPCLRNNREFS